MKIVVVSTMCPFCRGGVVLLNEPSDLSNSEITHRFAGYRVTCQHAGCEKSYGVRRVDVKIRRAEE